MFLKRFIFFLLFAVVLSSASAQYRSLHLPDGSALGFDAHGRLECHLSPTLQLTTFEVDAQGRVTSITNAIGKVTKFDFLIPGN